MTKEDNQRVWIARHVCVLILVTFSVIFSPSYLPQLLHAIGLSFHKAKWLTAWIETQDWLKLEFLPLYSPDFNPNRTCLALDENGIYS